MYIYTLCQMIEIKQHTSIIGVEQGGVLGPIMFKSYKLI